jgi:hypothetical protein
MYGPSSLIGQIVPPSSSFHGFEIDNRTIKLSRDDFLGRISIPTSLAMNSLLPLKTSGEIDNKSTLPTRSSPRGVALLDWLAAQSPNARPCRFRHPPQVATMGGVSGRPLDTILRGRPRRVPRSPWQHSRRPVALFASPSICTADHSQAILIRRPLARIGSRPSQFRCPE